MNIYKRQISIPLHLCEFVFNNKLIGELRLFIFLKKECDGQIKLPPSKRKEIAKKLSCSERSVRDHLKTLRDRNWIGFNPKSGYYFIRGFESIRRTEKLVGRKACRMPVYQKEIWANKEKFTAFLAGALIGHLSLCGKWRDNLAKRAVRSGIYKGLPNQNRASRFVGFYPVAADGIRQIYGIPLSTASDYKKLAKKHGYIEVEKSYETLRIPVSQVSLYRKSISCEMAKKVRVLKTDKGQKVILQKPDLVRPSLEYTKRYKQNT